LKIFISRHAKKQIKWRKINEQEIERVVNNPQDITPSVKNRLNYWENLNHKGLKITILKEIDCIVVVTAIRKGINL